MPNYDFECIICGQDIQEISCDASKFREQLFCQTCMKITEHKRKFPAPAVQFAGTGFYETDYKKVGANGVCPTGTGKIHNPIPDALKPKTDSGKPAKQGGMF